MMRKTPSTNDSRWGGWAVFQPPIRRWLLRLWVSKLVGGDANHSCKGAPHGIRAPKSTGGGNLFEAAIGSLQLLTSGFDARLQNILGRCPAQLAREYAFKISHAHRQGSGERLRGEPLR